MKKHVLFFSLGKYVDQCSLLFFQRTFLRMISNSTTSPAGHYFNMSSHCLVSLLMLQYLRVGLRITICNRTRIQNVVTQHVEAKNLLSSMAIRVLLWYCTLNWKHCMWCACEPTLTCTCYNCIAIHCFKFIKFTWIHYCSYDVVYFTEITAYDTHVVCMWYSCVPTLTHTCYNCIAIHCFKFIKFTCIHYPSYDLPDVIHLTEITLYNSI